MHNKEELTAILLAGGQASRMGFQDKALVNYKGRPLIAHVLDAIRGRVGSIVISYNRPPENLDWLVQEYSQGQVTVDATSISIVPDQINASLTTESLGPLAGIASCRPLVKTAFALILPCDMPDLPTDLVDRLAEALGGYDLAYAADGQGQQPLIMLTRTQALETIDAYLADGNRSVIGWCELQHCGVASFADSAGFRNVNRRESPGP